MWQNHNTAREEKINFYLFCSSWWRRACNNTDSITSNWTTTNSASHQKLQTCKKTLNLWRLIVTPVFGLSINEIVHSDPLTPLFMGVPKIISLTILYHSSTPLLPYKRRSPPIPNLTNTVGINSDPGYTAAAYLNRYYSMLLIRCYYLVSCRTPWSCGLSRQP